MDRRHLIYPSTVRPPTTDHSRATMRCCLSQPSPSHAWSTFRPSNFTSSVVGHRQSCPATFLLCLRLAVMPFSLFCVWLCFLGFLDFSVICWRSNSSHGCFEVCGTKIHLGVMFFHGKVVLFLARSYFFWYFSDFKRLV